MRLRELKRFISHLPKTETHLHVEGALPWSLLQERDPEKFSIIPDFRGIDFRYSSFEQFEKILIAHALEFFDSADSYHEVAKRIFADHLEQNVKYVETSFHAGMIELLKIPGNEIVAAIRSAVPKDLEVRIFLGISRNAYTPYLGPKLEEFLGNSNGLAGIDLHGLETLPMENWIEPFWGRAKAQGKIVKAHAGEFGPARNVSHAIKRLGVRRIQHGVKAADDPAVLKLAVDKQVTFDMCPISNYKLQVIDDWADHPLKSFLDAGISCTISTDDPFSFNNTLAEEYLVCHEKLGLGAKELARLAWNGFKVSDISESDKKKWQKEILDTLNLYN